MSYFGRSLRNAVSRGISKGVGDAIGKAIQQAVEPKATQYANRAAEQLDQAAGNTAQQARQTTSGLGGAFANLERSMQSYATQMSKNVKVCPSCQQATTADKKFCPSCGAKLPEETLAQSAVCPGCGKQNDMGMKFCSDCGTKLPVAVMEEQAAASKNAQTMEKWTQWLSQYPQWNCGGVSLSLDDYDDYYIFYADFKGNSMAAQRAVEQYRQVLQQAGFAPAGQYPNVQHLYKRLDGIVYHIDTEHCFEGDPDCVAISFDRSEPTGGFDYVKPQPAQKLDLGDLKGLKNLFKF